jgi:hypothetical protein
MRTLVAALAFAVLVIAVFAWLMLSHASDTAGGREPAIARGAARMGALEADTNRQGRDLSDIGLKVPDAAACSRLCAVDERCLAMSFVKGGDAEAGLCWLKQSVPSASENAAVVSAVKIPADP